MAAFAKLDASDLVTEVLVVNEDTQEAGAALLTAITGHPADRWVMVTVATGNPGAGQRWDGTVFLTPPPETVTMFQLRAALMETDRFTAVDNAVHALGGVALQAWEYAHEVNRKGTLVRQVATGLGVTDAELDDLFRRAAAISA